MNKIDKLSKKASEQLIKHLARCEASWLPIRHDWKASGQIYEARSSARVGVVHYGEAQESAAQRQLRAMATDQLVVLGLLKREARLYYSAVTPEGARIARAMAWAFQIDELNEAIERIHSLEQSHH